MMVWLEKVEAVDEVLEGKLGLLEEDNLLAEVIPIKFVHFVAKQVTWLMLVIRNMDTLQITSNQEWG